MTSAIYTRVSTTDQNAELQLRELREYAARGRGVGMVGSAYKWWQIADSSVG